MMIDGIHGAGTALARLALDAAALRHQAIAHNLANLHSEDYVPLGVSFESQLRSFGGSARAAPAQPRLVPEYERGTGPRPQDVDTEMVQLAQNTIHYQALLRALGVQMAILGEAIAGGGRP
jgi:flagellar basal-body rod protein FlgB